MRELIERLEQAKEGNRDLDAAIAVAVFKTASTDDDLIYAKMPQKADDCASGTYWRCSRSGMSLHTSPYYTTSLDAARTLVQEGYIWACAIERIYHDDDVSYEPDGKLVAYAEVKPDKVDSSIYRLHEIIEAQALTPELALCVAALEARS